MSHHDDSSSWQRDPTCWCSAHKREPHRKLINKKHRTEQKLSSLSTEINKNSYLQSRLFSKGAGPRFYTKLKAEPTRGGRIQRKNPERIWGGAEPAPENGTLVHRVALKLLRNPSSWAARSVSCPSRGRRSRIGHKTPSLEVKVHVDRKRSRDQRSSALSASLKKGRMREWRREGRRSAVSWKSSLLFSSSTCTGVQQQREAMWGPSPPPQSDLHAAPVHLDDLSSQRLDGGQDELLMVQRGDAEAQHISADRGGGGERSAPQLSWSQGRGRKPLHW